MFTTGLPLEPGRYRRRDLNNSSKRRDVSHRRDDSVGHAAFQTERISDDDNTLAFLWRRAIEWQRAHRVRRCFHQQDRDVAFRVYGQNTLNRIFCSG